MARLPSGASISVFDTLDSTSMEARHRIDSGGSPLDGGPQHASWIVALTQTSGYGRRGRDWEQQSGDFAGTLVLKPSVQPERLGQFSFVVALTLAATLDDLIDHELVSVKWPNDILIEGQKCVGILLETITAPDKSIVLTIGIGINIVTAPPDLPYPTTRLMNYLSEPPSPSDMAAMLDTHFWKIHDRWQQGGFNAIREAWLTRAAGIGQPVTVRLPNEEISGVFEGLDETGGLILHLASGKRIISAGEVFFDPPA